MSLFQRTSRSTLRFKWLAILVLLWGVSICAAEPTANELAKLLPASFNEFRQSQPPRAATTLTKDGLLRPEYFPASADPKSPSVFVAGESEYTAASGEKLLAEVVRFQSDSEAYSLLTLLARKLSSGSKATMKTGDVGTASISDGRTIAFFRGTTFARITTQSGSDAKSATELARLLANTIDKGEDDIPVLVKHLPEANTAQQRAVYAVNIAALREFVPNQPILDTVSFEGGTEAVVANYGRSQLVIVEFTTPQFSVDNDQRIWTKYAELKAQGQPVPTAYRRVGNYSVFVFNAPDEKTANALVDQVKYEQVVQWLGEDPHLYEKLQKYFAETSAGVLVAVLKSSGLSLLLCFAAGALIGAMLFRHRRAQRAAFYSDAGGGVRLNLDELTVPVSSQRLLPGAKSSEHDTSKS